MGGTRALASDRHAPCAPLRVLVVDDSAVARAVFARILAAHPDLVVAGQAAGADAAALLLERVAVDVVLLDLEMPRVNGLDALPELLRRAAPARVLVVSATAAAGAEATVRALRLGAADTLTKPEGYLFADAFGRELVDRIRRLGATAPDAPAEPAPLVDGLAGPPAPSAIVRAAPPAGPIEAVGIAASTGGVHALSQLLGALPADFAAPILVTQHLPAAFTPFFANQLRDAARRPVRIGAEGLRPQAGEILLAPGDAHLLLARVGGQLQVRLGAGRSASGCLPSADPMFAALAEHYGKGACAVVLSGMGRDGADGAAAIAAAGGPVAAQDRVSSTVWGMPGSVVRRGLATAVLPPAALAAWLAATAGEARAWN